MQTSRNIVERIVETKEVVYGISTGFGEFKNVVINHDSLSELQYNLIRSHCCGTGNMLEKPLVRMLLANRINTLASGKTGVRPCLVDTLLQMLNKNCLPVVYEKGSVGASGDLAPLSHIALGALGEGLMHHPTNGTIEHAEKVLKEHKITPIDLKAKEGLALINGTQFISALGAQAIVKAERLMQIATLVACVTFESLNATPNALDARIHQARGHSGQMHVASVMRNVLLHGVENGYVVSPITESLNRHPKVQDAYSLRCIPQVHGIVHDTIEFCKKLIDTELNAVTDNPMVFIEGTGSDIPQLANLVPYTSSMNDHVQDNFTLFHTDTEDIKHIVSGGNFHGEYPAKAMDFLAIGVHELANISERRINRLVDGKLSGLPFFLIENGGLNSGFMIPQYTAAALTSENKVLVHPSSSDTISTSASSEDHVSMGPYASRKCLEVIANVETVIAIELMAACQALDLRRQNASPIVEKVKQLVRQHVPYIEKDVVMHPLIEKVVELVRDGSVLKCAGITENHHN
ncbi:hypothetical protein C9374_006840 [Naegleria lovaniensis]|uniref:Histidine ammonia-lyase n=1 Tax=Naegleria lovaniensis TaxID=51637 RepID=A0AA88KS46_NAELO|nr:uncharacterized protein C9374_006840 [Naegleria lovaniensis]KAG2393309.1 hypothetical protein C9374_006840 [Naegleria lovaniensis]